MVSLGPTEPSPLPWVASCASDAVQPERRGPLPETLALLGALLGGPLEVTPASVPDRVAREASGITAAFLAWHLDRNLRSLAHVER